MSEHLEFSVKQIVWATVEQYPSWPAKIVRKINLHDKTVYKVNFFGDSTYCYLHSHSLLPFDNSETSKSIQVQQNPKLRRAIELARYSISKQYQIITLSKNQSSLKTTQLSTSPIAHQQIYAHSENNYNLLQKTGQLQNFDIIQNTSNDFSIDTILPSNVLQILSCYHNGKMTQRIKNLKRKQVICFQNQLKQNLLFKYKLNNIDILKQTSKIPQTQLPTLQEQRIVKKLKKKNQIPKFQQKELCLRKIQKMLFQKGMERHMTYNTALKIVNQIETKSESMRQSCPSYFKENIIRIFQQLNLSIQQNQQVQVEYMQKNILSFLDIQFHNSKFEEGSRMTQMYEEFGI